MDSGKSVCMTLLDQWTMDMHMKIDEKREKLQRKIDKLDEQIEDDNDYWKIFLKNQLDIKVGCVLTELLKEQETDESKLDKARRDFIRVEKFFHLLDDSQLMFLHYNNVAEIDFNSPELYFPSITPDDFDWMKKLSLKDSDEIMEWLDTKQNSANKGLTSCKYN